MSTTYNLNTLIDWVRRAASDRLIRNRETFTGDGTNQVVLSNDGNVVVTALTVNGVAATYTQDVNVLTITPTPASGANIVCVYNRSIYTDTDVNNFIVDGTKGVVADLSLHFWQFNTTDPTNPQVAFPDAPPPGEVSDAPEKDFMDPQIERLIVLRTAIQVRRDVANTNADDSILIKDGDTTIDTSRTSKSTLTVVQELQKEYDVLKRQAIANRSGGIAIQNNWVPLPYPWSTPNMMPGEVNGPAY